jgi:hypothetical protein
MVADEPHKGSTRMERQFPETDWKVWRKVLEVALERYCTKILHDAAQLEHGEGSAHSRYLALFKLIEERDETMGLVFNNPRRSTAFIQIATAVAKGIVTREDLSGLSEETQAALAMPRGL